MRHASVTSSPTPDDVRALARSSPWRFRTLHWTHQSTDVEGPETTVEAWLERPGRLTVRDRRGVHVAEGPPYGTSVQLEWPTTAGPPGLADPAATPGLAAPEPRPTGRTPGAFPTGPAPVLGADGLVAERPDGYHFEHGDPMWQSYLWTAMLDPEELSHHVDLADVHADDRHGRATWWATARAAPGYEPRCGCCPLLLGRVSVELEFGPFDTGSGMRGRETRWDGLPTAYLVGLDVQTGVVVDVTPLDGSGGTRLSNEIHAVDTELTPPTSSDGRRSR